MNGLITAKLIDMEILFNENKNIALISERVIAVDRIETTAVPYANEVKRQIKVLVYADNRPAKLVLWEGEEYDLEKLKLDQEEIIIRIKELL